jgi:hypothetical protein
MEEPQYAMELVSWHRDPLTRLITEGVLIKSALIETQHGHQHSQAPGTQRPSRVAGPPNNQGAGRDQGGSQGHQQPRPQEPGLDQQGTQGTGLAQLLQDPVSGGGTAGRNPGPSQVQPDAPGQDPGSQISQITGLPKRPRGRPTRASQAARAQLVAASCHTQVPKRPKGRPTKASQLAWAERLMRSQQPGANQPTQEDDQEGDVPLQPQSTPPRVQTQQDSQTSSQAASQLNTQPASRSQSQIQSQEEDQHPNPQPGITQETKQLSRRPGLRTRIPREPPSATSSLKTL